MIDQRCLKARLDDFKSTYPFRDIEKIAALDPQRCCDLVRYNAEDTIERTQHQDNEIANEREKTERVLM